MTDLKNGIIEIQGYEINAKTTPEDIKKNLEEVYCHYNKIPTGEIESFLFDEVFIYDCMFTMKISFYWGKLRTIKLQSRHKYKGEFAWEKAFEFESQWLEKVLGKAHTSSLHSRGYAYGNCHIRSVYLSDPRWGDEAFIDIDFGE